MSDQDDDGFVAKATHFFRQHTGEHLDMTQLSQKPKTPAPTRSHLLTAHEIERIVLKAEVTAPFRLSIPLQPTDHPRPLDSKTREAVKDAYAVRYLESIGAAPSEANKRQLLKALPPLDEGDDAIRCFYRARGSIADYVEVNPAGPDFGKGLNSLERRLVKDRREQRTREQILKKLSLSQALDAMEGQQQQEQDGPVPEEEEESVLTTLVSDPSELFEPFSIAKRAVKVIQESFVRTFPWQSIEHKVSNVKSISDVVLSDRVASLISLLCHSLHLSIVMSMRRSLDATERGRQKQFFVDINLSWASLQASIRQRWPGRTSALVVIPIVLLCVRTSVEAVLSKRFPRWACSPEGAHALSGVERAVGELLDPEGYRGQLSVFQSTTEALAQSSDQRARERSRFPQAAAHVDRFHTVSPAIRSLLVNPTSLEAKQSMLRNKRRATVRHAPEHVPSHASASAFFQSLVAPPPDMSAECLSGLLRSTKLGVRDEVAFVAGEWRARAPDEELEIPEEAVADPVIKSHTIPEEKMRSALNVRLREQQEAVVLLQRDKEARERLARVMSDVN